MPETMQFRAALNGYNREDVVAYIDQMSREHEEAVTRLQEKNTQLRVQLEAANEALAAAEDDAETKQALSEATDLITELRNQNQQLEAQVKELEQTLASAGKNAAPETVTAPNTQDLEEPIPPVTQVLPVELAPARDYSELELAAYRRAELAERMARERAGDVYRQIQSVFNQANTKLGTGKSDLEQLTKALSTDVNQLIILLTNLTGAYQNAEASFAELGEKNRRLLEGEE